LSLLCTTFVHTLRSFCHWVVSKCRCMSLSVARVAVMSPVVTKCLQVFRGKLKKTSLPHVPAIVGACIGPKEKKERKVSYGNNGFAMRAFPRSVEKNEDDVITPRSVERYLFTGARVDLLSSRHTKGTFLGVISL